MPRGKSTPKEDEFSEPGSSFISKLPSLDCSDVVTPARKKLRSNSSPIDIAAVSFDDDDDFCEEASDFEDVEEGWLASALSRELSEICSLNEKNAFHPTSQDRIGIFFSTFPQPFALENYVLRLVRYMDCSKAAFVVAMIYLDRLQRADNRFVITEFNVHRLFLTAIVIAAKFLDDSVYKNSHYAFVGGITSIREMNRLEEEMLRLLEFQVCADADSFRTYESILSDC
mmetsp:Transcript_32517/g.79587  ORF Transcript_32517/g.79587 Transcript_32517/m.79587 type:complete len:228 (+) Transcript_32517:26-709(+)